MRDATHTTRLQNTYYKQLIALVNQFRTNLQPTMTRLFNRNKEPGFIRAVNDRLNAQANGTIIIGAPTIIKKNITQAYIKGKKTASGNMRIKNNSIMIPFELSPLDHRVIDDLRVRNMGFVTKMTEDMKTDLLRVVSEGVQQQQSTEDIIRAINQRIPEITRSRAETIARTEISFSYNNAISESYRDIGIEKWQWLAALGYHCCDECIARHGNVYDWTDERPPLHPNCLTENTMYKSPSGLIAGLRADFNGPVMKFIFANGRELTVTPNHLILTPQGFASAKFLHVGDNVINSTNFERITTGHPDDDREPSSVKDIFHSLLETSTSTPVTMPISSEYLHGDGVFSEGNIDIVWSDCFLKDKRNSKFLKMIAKYNLTPANVHLFAFSGFSPLAQFGFGAAFASDGIMRFNRHSASFFRSRVPVSDMLNFSKGAMIDSSLNQSSIYDGPADIQLLRNLIQRYSTVVQMDDIVDIKVMSFHGKVYDFNTYNSLGIANSVITSNCLCTIYPVVDKEFEK